MQRKINSEPQCSIKCVPFSYQEHANNWNTWVCDTFSTYHSHFNTESSRCKRQARNTNIRDLSVITSLQQQHYSSVAMDGLDAYDYISNNHFFSIRKSRCEGKPMNFKWTSFQHTSSLKSTAEYWKMNFGMTTNNIQDMWALLSI